MLRQPFLLLLATLMASATAVAQTVVFTPSTTTINPAGGAVTFSVSITYATAPSVLAFSTTLPAGWTYGTSAGPNVPPITPPVGTTGTLSWSYITTPASPAVFDFTTSYPAGLTGLQPLTTATITRDTTDSLPVTTAGPILTLVAPPTIGLWLGGAGNWTDMAQWSGGTVAQNAGNATFTAQISAGTATIGSGSNIVLNSLQFSGGVISGLGTLTLVDSGSVWSAGAFSALNQILISPGAQFTASTFADHNFNGTMFINQGHFLWQNGGALRSGNGGAFINSVGATFMDATSGAVPCIIANGFGGTFTFTNAGSFIKTAASTTAIQVPFINTGTLQLNAGTLQFAGTPTAFTQTSGLFRLASGTTAVFPGDVTFTGGAIIGSGVISGNVTNGAFLSPGDILGTLTVQGNLSLLSTSQLSFDIGGTTQGTGYDFLSVTGNATLGGTLVLNVVNGARSTLLPTDSFTLLSSAALLGTFSNAANGARLMSNGGMGSFVVNYTSTALILSNFDPVPEPSTWALLGTGLGALAAMRRRRR